MRRHRSSRLEIYARQNRSNLNPPEQAMWRVLRGGQLRVWFRRQVPLGDRYIADVLAARVKLVVEVDGQWVHQLEQASDRRRDEWLRRRDYSVVRVDARVALRQPELAAAQVRRALAALLP